MFCREHAVRLHRDRQEFEGAGVNLVLIGQGTTEDGARFKRKYRVDLPLLVDSDRRAYKLAGMRNATFNELLGPAVVWRGIKRAVQSGLRQGRTVGHPAQLGGVLVIAPDGTVAWAHLAEDASDNPPTHVVLEAARRARVGA